MNWGTFEASDSTAREHKTVLEQLLVAFVKCLIFAARVLSRCPVTAIAAIVTSGSASTTDKCPSISRNVRRFPSVFARSLPLFEWEDLIKLQFDPPDAT
jgi:hypothetical protein